MTSSPKLRIGQAYCPFTLPAPVAMPGFAARTEPSVGTLAPPPRASAVAFEEVVLISLDVIGTDAGLGAEIAAGLPGVPVLVTATHTHSGPAITPGRFGLPSTPARSVVIAAAQEAAQRALAARRPATLEWMVPTVPGLAHERRNGGITAPQARLTALRWRTASEVAGWLVSYPCHPTVIGPTSRSLSPDYPGWLRAELEESGGVCVFLTGCAGDLNAGHQVSASFRLDPAAGRTPHDAARFGETLAIAIQSAEWHPLAATRGVRLRSTDVVADYGPLTDDPPQAQQHSWRTELVAADPGTKALLTSWIEWAERSDAGTSGRYRLPVALLEVGEAELCLLPGEPFLSADLSLRGDRATIVAGYYADVPGYLPSSAEYQRGGYEVVEAHRYYGMPAPFAPGTLEQVVAAVEALRGSGGSDG